MDINLRLHGKVKYFLCLTPHSVFYEEDCPSIALCEIGISTNPKIKHFDKFFTCPKLFTQCYGLNVCSHPRHENSYVEALAANVMAGGGEPLGGNSV